MEDTYSKSVILIYPNFLDETLAGQDRNTHVAIDNMQYTLDSSSVSFDMHGPLTQALAHNLQKTALSLSLGVATHTRWAPVSAIHNELINLYHVVKGPSKVS